MLRSLNLYLSDLADAADDIVVFTSGLTYPEYERDRLVRAAVERKFEIIGEALSQVRRHYPEFMIRVDESSKIIDFRNYLIHQYSTVDHEAVWAAVESKLPAFRKQIARLLLEVEPPPS
jgi:uncharacterized protein with HEPN domain